MSSSKRKWRMCCTASGEPIGCLCRCRSRERSAPPDSSEIPVLVFLEWTSHRQRTWGRHCYGRRVLTGAPWWIHVGGREAEGSASQKRMRALAHVWIQFGQGQRPHMQATESSWLGVDPIRPRPEAPHAGNWEQLTRIPVRLGDSCLEINFVGWLNIYIRF
jgi:hypothetical protein